MHWNSLCSIAKQLFDEGGNSQYYYRFSISAQISSWFYDQTWTMQFAHISNTDAVNDSVH